MTIWLLSLLGAVAIIFVATILILNKNHKEEIEKISTKYEQKVEEAEYTKQALAAKEEEMKAKIAASTRGINTTYTVDFSRGNMLNEKIMKLNAFNYNLVVDYLESIAGDRTIVERIIFHSLKKEVPISLSFGICQAESGFIPDAINKNNRNGSIDRGLFQLNNKPRPQWKVEDYFDIEKNIEEGIKYIKENYNLYDGNILLTIGAFNKGATGIKSGAGFETLLYMNKVITYQNSIEENLNEILETIKYYEESKIHINGWQQLISYSLPQS